MCRFQFALALLLAGSVVVTAGAQEIRNQATVNLTFDEPAGPALDTATAGAVKDNGTLVNSAARIRSPFWGQAGKQAVVLDSTAQQVVQVPDSADLDRPDAVTFSLLFASLHAPQDGAYRGLIGKRDDGGTKITNYGINYVHAGDVLQVYINDSSGYKTAQYSTAQAVGSRRPGFLTAVLQVGDAPAPDADVDADDVLVRFYLNGQQLVPKSVSGGIAVGADGWLTDVKVATLVNNVPLTLGGSAANLEFASCLIDEFSLFPKALTSEEVAKLFREVIGAATSIESPPDGPALQAGPDITATSLYGLQAGQTTTLTISGANLSPNPVVVLPVPIAAQVVKPGANANQFTVDVTLAADIPVGHYSLRVKTDAGVSSALPVAIDTLSQIPAVANTPDKPQTLPAALSGTISGQQQFRVFFAGKGGQRVVADVECTRLGSAMLPVLELRSPRGSPLRVEWGHRTLGGDARIEVILPADGVYSFDLHDLSYNAPGANPFRLKLGDLKLADSAYPPVVAAGTARPIEVIGTGFASPVQVPANLQGIDPGLTRIIAGPLDAAPGVIVRAGSGTEVVEEAVAAGQFQTVDLRFAGGGQIPTALNGRLMKPGEVDQYVLQATPGMTLNFQVDGSATAAVAPQINILSHPQGVVLASSDDRQSLDFAIPAGEVRLALSDLNGRGGSAQVYRIRIQPAGQPSFSLVLSSAKLPATKEGSTLRIDVNRQGYNGPIKLSLVGAQGLSISPAEIPAGATKALAAIKIEGAGDPFQRIQVRGESVGLNPPLTRLAQAPANPRLALLPEAGSELAVVAGSSAGLSVELSAAPPALFKGTEMSIPIALKALDPAAAKGVVRLSLVTTEATRPVDPKDPNKGLLPLIRSLPEQTLQAGEAAGVLISIPTDVAEAGLDAVIRADLVSNPFSDKILATVYSRPFTVAVQSAVAMQLPVAALQLKGNSPVKFAGTVKRTAGFAGAVSVSVLNLPAGYAAAPVTLAGDQETFELTVTSPAVTAAADLPNIVLRITGESGRPLQADAALPTKIAP